MIDTNITICGIFVITLLRTILLIYNLANIDRKEQSKIQSHDLIRKQSRTALNSIKNSPIKENYSPYDDRRSIKKRLIFENASECPNSKLKRNRISLNEIDSFTNNTSVAKDFNTDRIYLYDKSSEFSMNLGNSELQAGFISDRKRAVTKKSHSMIEDKMLTRPNRIVNQENKDYFK